METPYNKGDSEYIFWLSAWADKSASFWANVGRFKCTITRRKISVIPVENERHERLDLDTSLIQKCELYGEKNSNSWVRLSLQGRKILLMPVNPFDPTRIALSNDNEASAMIAVIEAFRAGVDPTINTNPYLRERVGNKPRYSRYRELTGKWEEHAEELNPHVSPWDHYKIYGDKFFVLKTLAVVMLSAISATALILVIAYVLDALNII